MNLLHPIKKNHNVTIENVFMYIIMTKVIEEEVWMWF